MVCIYCGGKTQVTNSRLQKRLNHVWRRRECLQCHAIFTTEEAADYSGSIVVRSQNGTISPFSRDKLFSSLLQSLGHRPTAVDDAGALTATIVAHLVREHRKPAISPSEIIKIAHITLERFDTAAAVQYAAYHKA